MCAFCIQLCGAGSKIIQCHVFCYIQHCSDLHMFNVEFSTSLTCRERERMLAQSLGPPIVPLGKADMPRFTGGGFNLKQTHKSVA